MRYGLCGLFCGMIITLLLSSCASRPAVVESAERETNEYTQEKCEPYRPPMIDMSDVMQAKLVHMHAIVEGLALGELRQVAVNAAELHALSERASWMVHDTITYIALSEEFRRIVFELETYARDRDMENAISTYTRLTNSCVACHQYLRRERMTKDLPGAVSQQSGGTMLENLAAPSDLRF